MSVIARRVCDICAAEYDEEKAAWMILSAPNTPDDVVAEYDFCGWQCLHQWVTTDEEDKTPPSDPANQDEESAQQRLTKAMAEMEAKPPMNLAEAIASGKLDFTRGPE